MKTLFKRVFAPALFLLSSVAVARPAAGAPIYLSGAEIAASLLQLNVIEIERGRIVSLIYDENVLAAKLDGDASADDENGARRAIFRFRGGLIEAGDIRPGIVETVFVVAEFDKPTGGVERRSYSIIAKAANIPGQLFSIVSPFPPRRPPSPSPPEESAPPVNLDDAGLRGGVIKRLLVAMALDKEPADVTVQKMRENAPIFAEIDRVLTARYRAAGGLVGEAFVIRNIDNQAVVIDEREFHETPDIVAIAIERHRIEPGESTRVFVFRRESEEAARR